MEKLFKYILLIWGITMFVNTTGGMLNGEMYLYSLRLQYMSNGGTLYKYSESPIAFLGVMLFGYSISLLMVYVAGPKKLLTELFEGKKESSAERVRTKYAMLKIMEYMKKGKVKEANMFLDKLIKRYPKNEKISELKSIIDKE